MSARAPAVLVGLLLVEECQHGVDKQFGCRVHCGMSLTRQNFFAASGKANATDCASANWDGGLAPPTSRSAGVRIALNRSGTNT